MSSASTDTGASGMPREEAIVAPAPAAREERFPHIESVLGASETSQAAPDVKQTFGVIEGRDEAHFSVRIGADLVRARRAKGCLVEPETGDTVLLARSEHHGSFVLSVLVGRDDAAASVIAVDGDLTLRSKTGRVALVGGEGVSVTSGGEVAVNAPSLVARTMSATIFSDTLSYVGRALEAQVERAKVLGQTLDTVIDHVTSRVKHSFKTVEELERVKAKELHVDVEATLNMHGKNTLMTAEKIVKLDGEQILIG